MRRSKNKENETIRKRKAVDLEGDARNPKSRKFSTVLSMLQTRLSTFDNNRPESARSMETDAVQDLVDDGNNLESMADSHATDLPKSIAYGHAPTLPFRSPPSPRTAELGEQLPRPGATIAPPDKLDTPLTNGDNDEDAVESCGEEVQTDFINDLSELYDDILDTYSADEDISGDMLNVTASPPLRSFCSYNGESCGCTEIDHQYDSALPSNSPAHVDDSCRILRVLNLKFHKRHRYLICTCYQGTFLALQELKDHLKKKHKGDIRDGNTRSMRDFPSVVDHISTSFNIPITQQSRPFTKEDFDGPIAGIHDPVQFHLCPWPSCKSYCVSMDSLKAHHQVHQMPLCKDDVVLSWTQFPFAAKGSHATRVEVDMSRAPLAVAPTTTSQPEPSIRRYVTPHGVTAPTLRCFDNVGFTRWRDAQLGNNCTISSLRATVALPAQRASKQPIWRPLTIDGFLRVVGGKIRTRAIKMLKDANDWLGDSQLRAAITAGTRAHYNVIKDGSYESYARLVQQTCMFVIRPQTTDLPTPALEYPRSRRQDDAFNALGEFASQHLACEETCHEQNARLDELIFEVLESLFIVKLVPVSGITCLTDLILMLVWLRDDGSPPVPTTATHYCGILQYWAFTTVVHLLRLHVKDFPKYVEHDGSRPPPSCKLYDEAMAESVVKLLHDLRPYITPQQDNVLCFTPFSSMKYSWVTIQKGVDAERSRAKFNWKANNKSFQYSRPGLPFIDIVLSTMRKLIHCNLGELHRRFEQLFPSTFPASRAIALPWGDVVDDATSPESFFDTAQIQDAWLAAEGEQLRCAYMDPSETRHRLTENGKLSRAAVDKLAALDEMFQDALIMDIQSNTAITVRLRTLGNYLYRTTPTEERHLYLMDGHLALYGGCQKAESRRDGYRELMVRSLCQQTQRCVLPYLGLFRSVLISIFEEARWHVDLIPMYQTHIIAGPSYYNNHSKRIHFSRIATPWHEASEKYFGSQLSIVDKRQIDTGVHKRIFPELLRDVSSTVRTVCDGMGDHNRDSNDKYYGRSSNLCRGLRAAELDEYLLTCDVHQSFMHTGPIDPTWPSNILQALPFHRSDHIAMAIDTASILVPRHYNFHQLSEDEIRRKVREICSTLPFLFRQVDGNNEINLEDELLLAIVAKLAWGDDHPHSLAVLPHGIEDVVDAANIILRTVDKWTCGKNTLCLQQCHPDLKNRYSLAQSMFQQKLSRFQANCSDQWDVFLNNVRKPQQAVDVYMAPLLLNDIPMN